MAPYAVAHLKLGMQLAGRDLPEESRGPWAYDFAAEDRLRVYLTNTLEEAVKRSDLLMGRYISAEANAAAEVKTDLPIMVVLGNPPYSGHSANRGAKLGELVRDYYQVDGMPLGERNPKWLQDDYVKFIRFGEWRIESTGAGILAFITNHSYLDNPTFRGMRQHLLNTFTDIYILDLHGNERKKERAPGGIPDRNVFDIRQGVAIGIFVKELGRQGPARVHHLDLWGTREIKNEWLDQNSIGTCDWRQLHPQPPFYLFTPQELDLQSEYQYGWLLTDIYPIHSMGMNTHRDAFVIDFDHIQLLQRIGEFKSANPKDVSRFPVNMNEQKARQAQAVLQADENWQSHIKPCLYRPFDVRYLYWCDALIDRPRKDVNHHMMQPNWSLVTTRQTREPFGALATRLVCGQHKITAVYDGSSFFPLYLYPDGTSKSLFDDEEMLAAAADRRRPNLSREFIAGLQQHLELTFISDGTGDLEVTVGPEDVFRYVYAVLHSPTYRSRYAEFLKGAVPELGAAAPEV